MKGWSEGLGTLASKRLYADPAKTQWIYAKDFTWNVDGTLNHWILTVITTSEAIRKNFTWNPDGTLKEAVTVVS